MCAHTCTMEYCSATKKMKSFVIGNNMDGLGWYFAKWNKSDRERQMLYDIYVESKNI